MPGFDEPTPDSGFNPQQNSENPYVSIHFSLLIIKRRNEDLQRPVQKFEVSFEDLQRPVQKFEVSFEDLQKPVQKFEVGFEYLHLLHLILKVRNVSIQFFFLIIKVRNEGLHETEKPGDSSPGLVYNLFPIREIRVIRV